MGRQVVSLGASCLTRATMLRVGISQPGYPFDDVWSPLNLVSHCLEDGFHHFLDEDNYLPVTLPGMWVHRFYREHLGMHNTFEHHDMSRPDNRSKFRRRVERFLQLRGADPLFFHCDTAGRVASAFRIARLRRALNAFAPASHLLVIMIGEGARGAERVHIPGATVARFKPVSENTGITFGDPTDDDRLCAILQACRDDPQGFRRVFA